MLEATASKEETEYGTWYSLQQKMAPGIACNTQVT